MSRVVISLGSNVADSRNQVARALIWMQSKLKNHVCSDIYETDDIHPTGRRYSNAVVAGEIDVPADVIVAMARRYEYDSGRDESARSRGDVPIDIDLVIYNGIVLRASDMEREYFLRGYRDICPEKKIGTITVYEER